MKHKSKHKSQAHAPKAKRARRVLPAIPPILIPILAPVVLLLPFVGRAFSIDDPLFLWMAKQILKHPGDPYGFLVNWSERQLPMWRMMQNPPLDSYYIAGVGRVAGFGEIALHLAFLLPAVAASLGTYMLARRFCSRPVEAVLAAVLTPAFLVCGSTVMCDMMLLAFWVWAIHLWVTGVSDNRPWLLVIASVLITAAAFTKYFGAVLIPLLLVYALAKRRPSWAILSLILPIVVLAAYQHWTKSAYGRGLVLDAAGVAKGYWSMLGDSLRSKLIVGLAFAGGCLASVIFHGPLIWTRRVLAAWAGVVVGLLLLLSCMKNLGDYPLTMVAQRTTLIAHIGIFAVGGLSLLVLAVTDVLAKRDADSVLLTLWLIGTLAFASLFNWTVNGRVLLPIAPVMGILIMRAVERRPHIPARLPFAAAWILSGFVALAVAQADSQQANSQRVAARTIPEQYTAGGTTWFEGHWGFQYYFEPTGARPVEFDKPKLVPGDVLITPVNNCCNTPPPRGSGSFATEVPTSRWVATMSGPAGTGFHSHAYGPVPYAFGLATPDTYYITYVTDENVAILRQSLLDALARKAAFAANSQAGSP